MIPRTTIPLFTALLGAFLAGIAAVQAQTVQWSPPGGTLGFGQTSQLELVFEDCQPDDSFRIPAIDGLSIGQPSRSSQTSIVNGSISQSTRLVFPVRPLRQGVIEIPSFTAATSEGAIRVDAARYDVGTATVGRSNITLDSIAAARIRPDPRTVWSGEVFPLTYTLLISGRYNPSLGGPVEWNADPLVIEPWGKPSEASMTAGNDRRIGIEQGTRGYIKQPGVHTLLGATQLVNLETGSRGFNFFGQPNLEQFQISTNSPVITVKPLPEPAPEGFLRAVGHFTFTAKVVPEQAVVGEPVTWTLTLEGTGNWPDGIGLPKRLVPSAFHVLQPQTKKEMLNDSLFDGRLTEDIVMVPTRPGRFTLGPLTYTFFNPESGSYERLWIDPVELTVAPAPEPEAPAAARTAPGARPPPGGGDGAAEGAPERPAPPSTPAPSAGPPVPRDPLYPADPAALPFRPAPILILSLLACVPPLLLWLALATLRARRTDPNRPRRAARREMMSILRRMDPSRGADDIRGDMAAWRAAVQRCAGVTSIEPPADAVAAALTPLASDRKTWRRLWQESDAVLYGPHAALHAEWLDRAIDACRRLKLPRWSPRRLLLRRVWWPFTISLALAVCCTPQDIRAGDRMPATPEEAAYQRGDFDAAAATWSAAIRRNQGDWSAHHNMGLVEAQKGRWGVAAAHWTTAWLLNPGNESVRWHFLLGCQRSNLADPGLRLFAGDEGWHGIAGTFSPATWQRILLWSLAGASIGGLILVRGIYLPRWRRRTSFTGAGVLLAAAATCVVASHAIDTYGILADRDAGMTANPVLLRTIPTEAETSQQTRALPVGTVGVRVNTFLSWIQIRMADGQTGWLRQEDFRAFYRHAEAPPPPPPP